MPSERFMRLSEDKKARIVLAAKNEFARVPYEAASINKIIQNAEISRGSFYTYFEDKRDLLHYVFISEHDRATGHMQELVLQCGGDLWEAADLFYRHLTEQFRKSDFKKTLQIIAQTGALIQLAESCLKKQEERKREEAYSRWMLEHVSREAVDVKGSEKRMLALLQMLDGAVMDAVVQTVMVPEESERALEGFRQKMNILKQGVLCETARGEEA